MRLSFNYDTDPHGDGRRARWYVVVLFWLTLITTILGVGWLTSDLSTFRDRDRFPVPTVTVIEEP